MMPTPEAGEYAIVWPPSLVIKLYESKCSSVHFVLHQDMNTTMAKRRILYFIFNVYVVHKIAEIWFCIKMIARDVIFLLILLSS